MTPNSKVHSPTMYVVPSGLAMDTLPISIIVPTGPEGLAGVELHLAYLVYGVGC
jgi:hypothetical protein